MKRTVVSNVVEGVFDLVDKVIIFAASGLVYFYLFLGQRLAIGI